MNVVLVSTYELGRQPFGLAEPAAWLRERGFSVRMVDLAVQKLDPGAFRRAHLVAFYLPMHTATRLAARAIARVREVSPGAHLAAYGLYAPMNAPYLRKLGVGTIVGGEFEAGLVAAAERIAQGLGPGIPEPQISLARQAFRLPDRAGLPPLERYARLVLADGTRRIVGYTEASRGCKHLCRHCPVVPVYRGRFRVVPRDVVLGDIRRQVAAGARHITFGDPDFFNGPGHALPLVEALHAELPEITYDVTIKVEHLLDHARHLTVLRDTGCLFVTSAVEACDDTVLEILDKGHTRADFIRVTALLREVGLGFNPTFVTFTPWTSLESYLDLLELVAKLDLVENVAPIQYAIRLLVPAGSKLLELSSVRELLADFDEEALVFPWAHPDPRVDRLCEEVLDAVRERQGRDETRRAVFREVFRLARRACSRPGEKDSEFPADLAPPRTPIPYLTEPWYC